MTPVILDLKYQIYSGRRCAQLAERIYKNKKNKNMAPNQKFSQGLHKPLQLLQIGSQFGEICSTYFLDQRSFPYILYACESGTFPAEVEKGRQAFEVKCYRKLLSLSSKDHVTNEEVRRKT